MSAPLCCICDGEPAPYPHLGMPTERICADCKELQDYAVDLAARQGEGRVGDVGERAAIREGRMTKAGKGGAR